MSIYVLVMQVLRLVSQRPARITADGGIYPAQCSLPTQRVRWCPAKLTNDGGRSCMMKIPTDGILLVACLDFYWQNEIASGQWRLLAREADGDNGRNQFRRKQASKVREVPPTKTATYFGWLLATHADCWWWDEIVSGQRTFPARERFGMVFKSLYIIYLFCIIQAS